MGRLLIELCVKLADNSPLPILIYNFPGVAGGLDLNSDTLATLGQHPNIVGVKLTCGGIAKAARIRASFSPDVFCSLAGQSDWLLPSLTVGSTGTITGVANLYPKVVNRSEAYSKCDALTKWLRYVLRFTTCTSQATSHRPRHYSSSWPKWSGLLAFLDPTKQAWISKLVKSLEKQETSLSRGTSL
jgi:4-hydroxy-2-oxoglutarate aldolase